MVILAVVGAVLAAAGSFVGGVLVGRRNRQKVEAAVTAVENAEVKIRNLAK